MKLLRQQPLSSRTTYYLIVSYFSKKVKTPLKLIDRVPAVRADKRSAPFVNVTFVMIPFVGATNKGFSISPVNASSPMSPICTET